MYLDTTLLLKSQIQSTFNTLPAPEQFQIGGIANVRGYPPAEFVCDRGYSFTGEWSFPTYFAKGIKVPYSKTDFYNALKWVVFYDWANGRIKVPDVNQKRSKTLSSAGCGWRFNLPEDFSVRFELAWAINDKPSDNYHVHPWCEVSKSF